ncbi:hypothetical protein B0H12DRAFT_1132429 [Mycena haematopus]|nr:hypothetical protein B0H12DRAFT_1132429 [Mycena haematopus]
MEQPCSSRRVSVGLCRRMNATTSRLGRRAQAQNGVATTRKGGFEKNVGKSGESAHWCRPHPAWRADCRALTKRGTELTLSCFRHPMGHSSRQRVWKSTRRSLELGNLEKTVCSLPAPHCRSGWLAFSFGLAFFGLRRKTTRAPATCWLHRKLAEKKGPARPTQRRLA